MPPGEPCPDDALPCDDPNEPEWCNVPTECPDGTIIPPGEQCPDVDYGEGGEDNDNGNDNGNDDSGDSNNDNDNDNDNGDNDDGSSESVPDVPEDSGSGGFFD